MRSKIFKILIILLIICIAIFLSTSIVKAEEIRDDEVKGREGGGGTTDGAGGQRTTASSALDTSKFEGIGKITIDDGIGNFGGKLIYIVQYVGYTVAVIVLLTIGIKYMMSAPNEKADLKARMIPYVIGAVIVFAGSSVISIIYDIVTSTP